MQAFCLFFAFFLASIIPYLPLISSFYEGLGVFQQALSKSDNNQLREQELKEAFVICGGSFKTGAYYLRVETSKEFLKASEGIGYRIVRTK